MPVEAASSAPTIETDTASPPRTVPNSRPIASSNSTAIFERSSMIPM